MPNFSLNAGRPSWPLRRLGVRRSTLSLDLMGPFSAGWTEKDVETVLGRGLPDELLYVPIVVGMNAADCDRMWAEDVCLRLVDHVHFNVRGNAVLGLGHIARTCGALSAERVFPVLERALDDPHPYVRGHAESAASEVRQYLGVVINGYEPHTDHMADGDRPDEKDQ